MKALALAVLLSCIGSAAFANDTALIRSGVVVQVWRKGASPTTGDDTAGTLLTFPDNAAVAGQTWDGATLTNPAPTPPAPIDKASRSVPRGALADAFTSCQTAGTAAQVLGCIRDALVALRDQ